jgi:glycosyltransferase involved in cell wall biosynthesis
MKLSIIIPAYNVEKYIERCIHSVVSQDIPLNEYEIIIVDDGSRDLTPQIVEEWSEKYNNIRTFTQQNSGQSAARNFALTKATGEYVFFIDADDKIEPNVLDNLTRLAKGNDLDILRFMLFNSPYDTFHGESSKVYTGIDFVVFCVGIWSPCIQLFKREFLTSNEFYFKTGITSEDAELLPRVYLKASKAMAIDIPVYYYLYNPNSTTKETKYDIQRLEKRLSSQLIVLKTNISLCNEFKDNGVKESIYQSVIHPTFTAFCTMIFFSPMSFKIAKKFQRMYLCSDAYPINENPESTLKHKIMFRIMNSKLLFNAYYLLLVKTINFKIKKLIS